MILNYLESCLSCIFIAMNYCDRLRSRNLFPLRLMGTWCLVIISADIAGVSSYLNGETAVGCLYLVSNCLDFNSGFTIAFAGLNTFKGTC